MAAIEAFRQEDVNEAGHIGTGAGYRCKAGVKRIIRLQIYHLWPLCAIKKKGARFLQPRRRRIYGSILQSKRQVLIGGWRMRLHFAALRLRVAVLLANVVAGSDGRRKRAVIVHHRIDIGKHAVSLAAFLV